VIVGTFENRTREHIAVGTFLKQLENAYVNSGAVRVLATRDERGEVREERADQQENARADTRTRMAQELGAKYMLQGTIEAIEDAQGREKVVYYQVDATLVDIESNQKVWTGQHQTKKYILRPRVRT
jgi:TolB-like protein